MYVDIRHRGAWFPADARLDRDASNRMAKWIKANVPNLGKRVVVTPQMRTPLDGPPAVLAALAKGAPHKSDRGGADWTWGSGPVVAAWPDEQSLGRCVPMAVDQTLILFEWPPSGRFTGWATATEAFNAATGETTAPLTEELHEEFVDMFFWDRELVGGALRGRDRDRPQQHLRNLHDAGLDEDFVVTYALALGQLIEPKHIRDHYRAAIGQPTRRRSRRR
jgi:hypothetical protein